MSLLWLVVHDFVHDVLQYSTVMGVWPRRAIPCECVVVALVLSCVLWLHASSDWNLDDLLPAVSAPCDFLKCVTSLAAWCVCSGGG
jgi:hypothetical protein